MWSSQIYREGTSAEKVKLLQKKKQMVNSRTEQNNNLNKKFPKCAQQKTGNDKRNYPTRRNKNKIKRLKIEIRKEIELL